MICARGRRSLPRRGVHHRGVRSYCCSSLAERQSSLEHIQRLHDIDAARTANLEATHGPPGRSSSKTSFPKHKQHLAAAIDLSHQEHRTAIEDVQSKHLKLLDKSVFSAMSGHEIEKKLVDEIYSVVSMTRFVREGLLDEP